MTEPHATRVFRRCLVTLPPGTQVEYDVARKVMSIRTSESFAMAQVIRHDPAEVEPAETPQGMLELLARAKLLPDLGADDESLSIERCEDTTFECWQAVAHAEDGRIAATRLFVDDEGPLSMTILGPKEWVVSEGIAMLVTFGPLCSTGTEVPVP